MLEIDLKGAIFLGKNAESRSLLINFKKF